MLKQGRQGLGLAEDCELFEKYQQHAYGAIVNRLRELRDW